VGKAREITDLAAEGSYAEAAAQIVSIRAREVVDHAEGVLDVEEIERVHDMRVATRRLRAALEIFEPCFPAKPWRAALADVKVLADALGERRDRDVAIEALSSFAAEMPTPDRPGVESLISDLISEQLAANDELAEHVKPERLAALHEQLTELVAAVKRPATATAEPSAAPEPPVAAETEPATSNGHGGLDGDGG
jgi:CHAD domain-containing protein